MYGHWNGYGMGWLGAVLGIVAMVVILGGLATAAVVLVRRSGTAAPASTARTILDERFARGEIDAEEYQSRRAALG
ncbi:SHOCT domain-containing protein [Actinokineospora sp. HUAS TT18]|uniref:SHOCT domain-containing protein n=1 Tax=Actinokineospora sp. HUAS TT18 TaxID=3447451 RepID=UPI003F528E7F